MLAMRSKKSAKLFTCCHCRRTLSVFARERVIYDGTRKYDYCVDCIGDKIKEENAKPKMVKKVHKITTFDKEMLKKMRLRLK